jgi:hypothetical protein
VSSVEFKKLGDDFRRLSGKHTMRLKKPLFLTAAVSAVFGEDRTRGLDPTRRYVACYSSADLAHWTFRHQVLRLANPENFGRDRANGPRFFTTRRRGNS